MDYILQISMNIIIIGWALIVILWIFICIFVLILLWRINSIVKDIKDKYYILISNIIRPFSTISHLLNKIRKNG